MGQNYLFVSVSSGQFIDPGLIGESKFSSIFEPIPAAMLGLMILDGGRTSPASLAGAWIGDVVVIAGDDHGTPNVAGMVTSNPEHPERNMYELALEGFEDVSLPALASLVEYDASYAWTLAEHASKGNMDALLACGALLQQRQLDALVTGLDSWLPDWKTRLKDAASRAESDGLPLSSWPR